MKPSELPVVAQAALSDGLSIPPAVHHNRDPMAQEKLPHADSVPGVQLLLEIPETLIVPDFFRAENTNAATCEMYTAIGIPDPSMIDTGNALRPAAGITFGTVARSPDTVTTSAGPPKRVAVLSSCRRNNGRDFSGVQLYLPIVETGGIPNRSSNLVSSMRSNSSTVRRRSRCRRSRGFLRMSVGLGGVVAVLVGNLASPGGSHGVR